MTVSKQKGIRDFAGQNYLGLHYRESPIWRVVLVWLLGCFVWIFFFLIYVVTEK